MKKINPLFLLLAAWLCITAACHKPDFPYKKLCQIATVIDSVENYGVEYRYRYTQKRLLDSLYARPMFNPNPIVIMKMEYDNLHRPVIVRDSQYGPFKYVYQAGRIIRVDEFRNNQFQTLYTYVLDGRGRVIERTGASQVLRWEYDGPSTNFKRRLYFDLTDLINPALIYEYQYDHKVNPLSTWPNTTLNPFYFPITDIHQQFEPIPQNNFVYEGVQGRNGDGTWFKFRESLYTYQYDDVYPVKRTARFLRHTPNDPTVHETAGVSYYYYECKDDIH
ncbi:hypothetical protein HB364_24165 [Pseudoflavitalea sp. X16]|uniref:hypothetical protein n=1 Tax=Paraflavitalea devenefica TaxID=2716334 RepID=UPI001422E44C|nr:hypothetical protein [Paraflavitalea devenefica]NII28200.1 hypothetical protein [Paraflavitalea devenefica]